MKMPDDIPQKVLTDLLVKVLKVEKQFAHELTGARNDRRAEIKKIVNKVVADGLEKL